MSKNQKVLVIRQLVAKGDISSAEVACDDWGIDKAIIKLIREGYV